MSAPVLTARHHGAGRGGNVPHVLISGARWHRLLSGGVFFGSAAVLAASFLLPPSPTGAGTHMLLALPPCWLYYLTGIPCPFCGMTTAFCHMARGQIAQAFACHVLGPPLYVLTWAVGLAGLWGLLTGRAPLPLFVTSARFQRGVLYVLLAAWIVQIVRHVT